jgi:tRNA-binding EMAP/Myf-like protein
VVIVVGVIKEGTTHPGVKTFVLAVDCGEIPLLGVNTVGAGPQRYIQAERIIPAADREIVIGIIGKAAGITEMVTMIIYREAVYRPPVAA